MKNIFHIVSIMEYTTGKIFVKAYFKMFYFLKSTKFIRWIFYYQMQKLRRSLSN